MPQATTFLLSDGKATPIVHTFNPAKPDKSSAQIWEEKSSTGVILGSSYLKVDVTRPREPAAMQRVRVNLSTPTLVTSTPPGATAPVTVVDYTNYVSIEFAYSQKSTTQDRKDLRSMLLDLFAEAQFVAIHDNLEGAW